MKKITINHTVLKDALKRIKQAVPSKAVMPSLENVLIKVTNPTALIIGTDLDITIQVELNIKTEISNEDNFEFLVPFEFLSKIVGLSDADIVFDLEENENDTTVYIRTANDEYSCGKMDELKDYPAVQKAPSKKFIDLNGSFIETLNNAVVCVSKDDFTPALRNVCLDITNDCVTIVATDKHALFSKRIDDGSEHNEQILVSPKTAKALEGFANSRVSWNKDVTAYQSNNVIVIAKNHEDKYVTWRAVMPTNPNTFLEVEKKSIESALEKCNLSNTETKQTVFTMHPESLRLESTSYEDGKYIKTELPATHTGELENICFNSKKLLALVGSISSATLSKNPTLKFSFKSHTTGTIITTLEDESFQLLIMPINLN